ncbi:MAG: ABC transporter ATP-binding protein [Clostridia bacterium]|nr:ABC transporter ATP-binding protein [Clostridia bacterium]
MIRIEHLSKSFGKVKAVQDVSFRVKRGELFAFLGVNGAGKSTTISVLCGQLEQDGGSVLIDGEDPGKQGSATKSKIGVVFQHSYLDKPLSVYENLKSRAAMYGLVGNAFRDRLAELTDMLQLEEILRRPVGKLSGGQRRRADVARALVHRPELLVLDEPTTGLDPQTRKNLWDLIARLRREEGMTVLLTTHYMEEAADADYVVILDKGRVVAEGTPLELKNRFAGDYVTLYGVSEEEIRLLAENYEILRDALRIQVPDTAAATELILRHPRLFRDYEITKGRMDDVFLAVTGRSLQQENGEEGHR